MEPERKETKGLSGREGTHRKCRGRRANGEGGGGTRKETPEQKKGGGGGGGGVWGPLDFPWVRPDAKQHLESTWYSKR